MKEFLENLLDDSMTGMEQEHTPMYVLSNENKLNGAAALFYPEMQEKIAERYCAYGKNEDCRDGNLV